ncbi:hypothetical protein I6L51_00730 [Citrobacter braakii]|nr:hypothetical protein [Citrobacter braakii]QXC19298.1 hypothetical protein I6L51_00730 [Citrobacter braakii]
MHKFNKKLATTWEDFTKGDWQNEVNVRDFIQKNTLHMKVIACFHNTLNYDSLRPTR